MRDSLYKEISGGELVLRNARNIAIDEWIVCRIKFRGRVSSEKYTEYIDGQKAYRRKFRGRE